MDLLKKEIFFKLKPPQGNKPQEGTKEFKDWRNNQKQPIGKWKIDKKFTYSQLQNHPNVGMIIPEGYVVVDIDDNEMAKKVDSLLINKGIKCIKSDTGKGKHFLFKDPRNKTRVQSNGLISLIGVKIDTRISNKGYVAVKFLPDAEILGRPNGERFSHMMDLSEVDNIPFWLETIKMQSSEKAKTIVNDKWLEGSRDTNLMTWVNIIWNTDIDKKKELYEVMEIINNFIMDKPLFRNDIEAKKKIKGWLEHVDNVKENTVIKLGDENQEHAAFGLKDNKSDVDYINLAQHYQKLLDIYYYESLWWIKKEKPWYEKTNDDEIFTEFIKKAGNSALIKVIPEKLFTALKIYSSKEKEDNKKYINFKNGKFNLETKQLEEYNNSEFITFGIDVEYKTNTTPNIIDAVLKQWTQNHQEEIDTLMEFTGSIMYDSNEKSKGIILYGSSAKNGKSTFLEMITSLIKSEYITSMNFTALESRFGAFDLIGKRLLQISELEDTYIEKSPIFKQVVGSTDYIEVEGKNLRHKIRFKPNVKFIGATNRFPRFGDQTNGIWRRIIIIPFNFTPTKEEELNFDKSSLFTKEAQERLVYLAIEGLLRYIKKGFTKPKRSKELEKEQRILADSVRAWENDKNAEMDEKFILGNTLSDTYLSYKNWCISNGYKPLGRNNFKHHLIEVFPDKYIWIEEGKKAIVLKDKSYTKEKERKLKKSQEEGIWEEIKF